MHEVPSITLYCLPYAGASAAVYTRWKRRLPGWVDVRPVELPGRGRRTGEPLQQNVAAVLDRIDGEVSPPPGQPFALFGHSFGAVLAFELARRLEARGLGPAVVFVSSTRSPGKRDDARFGALSTDAELRAEMLRLGGTPEIVLAEPELMQMILPVLRADFRVLFNYKPDPSLEIRAPLVALGGDRDETTGEDLDAWSLHTEGAFARHLLSGGHFYIQSEEASLLGIIERELRRHVVLG